MSTLTAPLDSALTKSRRRIIPFVALMFAMAIIDRSNVGYAKLALQADTGIGDAAFALGAGIFFIGYALFEVPSNLILHRIGARIWLSRIMVTWGLVSAAMMFAQSEMSFYILRFLLGVAEAGLSPEVVLYLTYWFPHRHRGAAYGLYYFGVPASLLLGGPVSGWLLEMHGVFGLRNWQWMFVVEGLLASVIGVIAFFYLPNRPRDARWLTRDEKTALHKAIEQEETDKKEHSPSSWKAALVNPKVMYFVLIYFTIQVSVYGVLFYLPARIAQLLGTKIGFEVGMLTAIPWLFTLGALFMVTRYADRTGKHRQLAVAMLLLAAVGIAGSTVIESIVPVLFAFGLAAAGFITVQPLFWTLPTRYLGGVAAASAIALIGALGNLGGFLAPTLKTYMEQTFANPHAGMYTLATVALLGAGLLALGGTTVQRQDVGFAVPTK